MIRLGRADVVVAGGTEAAIHPLPIAGVRDDAALSTRNDEPERASRPWDNGRDGFVLGEGAGVARARVRGARQGARRADLRRGRRRRHHRRRPPHRPARPGRARRLAGDPAGAGRRRRSSRRTIVHVNAHATSTPLGDIAEAAMLHATLGDARRPGRGHQHQVDDRPPARRRRRARGDRHHAGAAATGSCRRRSTSTTSTPRSTSTSPRQAARAARRRHRGAQQLVRLRRPQRRRRLQERLSVTADPGRPPGQAPRSSPREDDPRNPVEPARGALRRGHARAASRPTTTPGCSPRVGRIDGARVVAFCTDATVMGGAMGDDGCQRHRRRLRPRADRRRPDHRALALRRRPAAPRASCRCTRSAGSSPR